MTRVMFFGYAAAVMAAESMVLLSLGDGKASVLVFVFGGLALLCLVQAFVSRNKPPTIEYV
jgi:membrane protein implicated in regulation of membrane protease activity